VDLSVEAIEAARSIWFGHLQDVLKKDEQHTETPSFMETSTDLIFMLHSLFEYEYTEACPTTLHCKQAFIERSLTRTRFRLDFAHQMWQARLCQWTDYSKWTLDAIAKYPDATGLYRHLSSVFSSKSCHFRHFVDWKVSG
jgi:hypothetical protein